MSLRAFGLANYHDGSDVGPTVVDNCPESRSRKAPPVRR